MFKRELARSKKKPRSEFSPLQLLHLDQQGSDVMVTKAKIHESRDCLTIL